MEKENKELQKWIEADNEEVNNYTPGGESKPGKKYKTIKTPPEAGNHYYNDISNCY